MSNVVAKVLTPIQKVERLERMRKNDIFYGLKSLDFDEIKTHLIRQLYQRKYKVAEISSITGLGEKTIFRYLDKMDIQRKNKKSA